MKKEMYKWYDYLLSRLLTAFGFASCAVLAGCPAEYGPPTDYLEVSPDEIYFPVEGGETSVSLRADDSWTVTCPAPFIFANPTKGHGNAKIIIMAEENKEVDARKAQTYIVGSEGNSVTVKIYQQGK